LTVLRDERVRKAEKKKAAPQRSRTGL
jgi:hypothetical protein